MTKKLMTLAAAFAAAMPQAALFSDRINRINRIMSVDEQSRRVIGTAIVYNRMR